MSEEASVDWLGVEGTSAGPNDISGRLKSKSLFCAGRTISGSFASISKANVRDQFLPAKGSTNLQASARRIEN
jgi:hypothetical protein